MARVANTHGKKSALPRRLFDVPVYFETKKKVCNQEQQVSFAGVMHTELAELCRYLYFYKELLLPLLWMYFLLSRYYRRLCG
jgi:hypothetical protein